LRGESAGGLRFTAEREGAFKASWERKLRGHGEFGFALCMLGHYALTALATGRGALPAETQAGRVSRVPPPGIPSRRAHGRPHRGFFARGLETLGLAQHGDPGPCHDGGHVCRGGRARQRGVPQVFSSLHAVLRRHQAAAEHKPHYEMSCVPPGAEGWAYGCEFEPMIEGEVYSRDHFQSFKNAIYDIGVEMGASYYRFGGMMKGYIRRVFGDALVDRHLEMKRQADPAMILNRDVIF
jgi:hypothetical protein